jgi:hypothetical protein
MPTTKTKYGQADVFSIRRFTLPAETLRDLEDWMKHVPDAAFIQKLEDNLSDLLSFAQAAQGIPTPSEIRAAINGLLRKTRSLLDLLQKTDGYTRQQISLRDFIEAEHVPGENPVGHAQQSLLRLMTALDETRKRLQDVNSTGGPAKASSEAWRKMIEGSLRETFKQYGDPTNRLSAAEIDGCVESILDCLPSK